MESAVTQSYIHATRAGTPVWCGGLARRPRARRRSRAGCAPRPSSSCSVRLFVRSPESSEKSISYLYLQIVGQLPYSLWPDYLCSLRALYFQKTSPHHS